MIDPAKARERILRSTAANVEKYGLSVVYVGRIEGEDTEPFHYTVGRHGRGLPELLIAAPTDPEQGMHILNAMNWLMPEELPSGSKVDIGGSLPLMVINVTNPIVKTEYTLLVETYYGTNDYRVQQVVYPDRYGVFPNDPRCAKPYSAQVLLGEVT